MLAKQLLLLCIVAISACSAESSAPAATTDVSLLQCAKDMDCKGDRICEDGKCVNPAAPALLAGGGSRGATPATASAASAPAQSSGDTAQSALLEALKLKAGTTERMASSGKAIQAFIANGAVGKAADTRADYSDYRLLKQALPFMGHELVALEEEYMSEYVGCCVSPGIAATVKLQAGGEDLDAFAAANGCRVERDSDEYSDFSLLHELGLARAKEGSYATLSCKERDISTDP